MTGIIAFLIKIGFGGIVGKAIDHMEHRAELEAKVQNDRNRLHAMTTIELAKAAVAESKVMADFNKEKLRHWPFWLLVLMVSAPFIVWEWAVVIDGLPYARDLFGDQQVANLPTQALQDAFAAMIKWVFFVGTGVGGVKLLGR